MAEKKKSKNSVADGEVVKNTNSKSSNKSTKVVKSEKSSKNVNAKNTNVKNTNVKKANAKKTNNMENKKEQIVVEKKVEPKIEPKIEKPIKKEVQVINDEYKDSNPIVKIVLGIVLVVLIVFLVFKACSKEEYTVTFDSNGGTKISEIKVNKDGKLEEPEAPTREGYEFDGWYYDGELYDFDNPVTGDIKLEARWVELVKVTGVELNKKSMTLAPGETTTLVATVKPENAKDKSLTWESSDSDVVIVDKNGNVEALKEGTATITVTTKDGKFTAKVKITVEFAEKDIAVTGIRVSNEKVEIKVGKTAKVTATVLPTNATNKDVVWKSSDTKIAKVSSTGVITGIKPGKATITVTTVDGGYSETISVTVTDTVKAEKIIIEGKNTGVVGNKIQLTATVSPTNAEDRTVMWSSSNEDIATVDEKGIVTLKEAGTVSIIAKTGYGATASYEITVKYLVVFKDLNKSYEVVKGTLVQDLNVETPEQPNKIFNGWKNAETGAKVTATTKVLGNVTFEADWLNKVQKVRNEEELKEALATDYIETIKLASDFAVSGSIIIDRDVTIAGAGHTISMADDVIPSENGDNYVFKVFGADNKQAEVTFRNITITNANAAILVGDNADVIIDGVNVDGNVWGGIEVKDTDTTILNVKNIAHTEEAYGKPTVWVDKETVENAEITIDANKVTVGSQVHYYIDENSITTRVVTNESELLEALKDNNITTIELGSDIEITASVVISREVTIDGTANNYTIKMSGTPSYVPNGDNYVLKVYGGNVKIANIKLTNSMAAMMVGDNSNVTVENVNVDGNVWGGIEVKNNNASLTVNSINYTEERYAKPVVWVDAENLGTSTITGLENSRVIKGQVQYYLNSENLTKAVVTNESELLEALKDNNITTIELGSDIEITASVVISRDITINGNNKKISFANNSITIDVNSHVTVNNIQIEGNIINNGNLDLNEVNVTSAIAHSIVNNGELTVEGGTYDALAHGKAALVNNGIATINGGTFERSNEAGVSASDNGGNSYYYLENYGTMTINDATIESTGKYSSLVHNGWYDGSQNTAKKDAKLIINGGTFDGGLNTVKNDDYGVLEINDGTYINSTQHTVLNWNKTTINGGIFSSDDIVISNNYLNDDMDKGIAIITGGVFTTNNGTDVVSNNNGHLTITGGKYNKDVNEFLTDGYTTVNNGDYFEVVTK